MIKMPEEQEKLALKNKYTASRKWFQATENYGFYSYPSDYYNNLLDIVLKYCSQRRLK